jgi:H+-translocating NAD(P) transhydrogenase subunit alpha
MMIKQIVVVKETREGEFRVALTPREVTLLVSKNHRVLVESQAGLQAGFKDQDYVKAGAEIFSITPKGFPADSLILRVKRANKEQELIENNLFHENTSVIGFLDPLCPLIMNGHDLFKSLMGKFFMG